MRMDFQAGIELSDTPLVLGIVETGGASFTVTLNSGRCFLSVTAASATGDYAALVTPYAPPLLARLTTACNAGTGSGSYAWTFDPDTQRVTVVHTGGSVTAVQITPTTGGGLIGMTGVVSASKSHTMQRTPDYWIGSAVGYYGSDWSGEYEGGEGGVDVEAHDGTPSGIAVDGLPTYLDFSVPLEPVAVVGNHPALVSASQPWTWRDLFRYVRNEIPIAVVFDTETLFVRLRAEGSRFRPRALGGGYLGHWDIPLQTRVLGRV